jgi:cytochrome b involved in lipid metabolism
MKKFRTIFITIFAVVFTLLLVHTVIAGTVYNKTEVSQHNSESSCWVIYNGGVYDITTYLVIHNQHTYITNLCGTDITSHFTSVARHKSVGAYSLIETFRIGTLESSTTSSTTTSTSTSSSTSSSVVTKQLSYNLFVPLILGFVLYWGSRYIVLNKKIRKPDWVNIKNFNAFWNTLLLITFLIPTFGFGLIMIIQLQYPSLLNLNFNILYWHAEFSVFMGALALSHFLHRIKIYFAEVKRK